VKERIRGPLQRNEATQRGKEIWKAVDNAGSNASPKWAKDRMMKEVERAKRELNKNNK